MMLKVAKRNAVSTTPSITLLYGAPKVGKTTMLSKLNECLILDTENGSKMIDGHILDISSRDDLISFYTEAEAGHKFKYVALDTVDRLIEWVDYSVCSEFQVDAIADLAYGKGFGLVRQKVINNVKKLSSLFDHVIVIGHRKTAAAVDNSNAVDPESLDISGKLKNMLMAMSDAVGYVHRNEDDELKVSFQGGKSLEAGSRCPHLKGKIVDFDWNLIFKEKVENGTS